MQQTEMSRKPYIVTAEDYAAAEANAINCSLMEEERVERRWEDEDHETVRQGERAEKFMEVMVILGELSLSKGVEGIAMLTDYQWSAVQEGRGQAVIPLQRTDEAIA